MSMPPRQPRTAGGRVVPNDDSNEPVMGWQDRAQQALDFSRKALPYVPVVGPAYEMFDDLEQGDYTGAAVNGVMLAADLSPFGPANRVIKVLDAINGMRRAPLLARAATQTARIRKIENVGKEYEVHHTIPMGGWSAFNKSVIPKAERSAEGLFRNHPANLKVMDKATHRRLTGQWTDPETGQVLDQFNAMQRVWHGTNALQKTTALAAGATAADWGENIVRPFPLAREPANERPRPILDPTRGLDVRRTEQGFIISHKR